MCSKIPFSFPVEDSVASHQPLKFSSCTDAFFFLCVRNYAQAVTALERLQDPTSAEDAVTSAFVRILSGDSSKEVRKSALRSVAATAHTLPFIIARCRDAKEDVRQCAYKELAMRVHVHSLVSFWQ